MDRAWHGRGMSNVNQTRPHYVNQMGKTHSKTLAARHGRGTAWARHAMCESALRVLSTEHGTETCTEGLIAFLIYLKKERHNISVMTTDITNHIV
jgi:hypothetical protein